MKTDCLLCKQPFRKIMVFAGTVLKLGDCYSEAGWRETQLSGYCEFCFDNVFGLAEDETAPSDYDRDCDACLFDRHTCSRCNDVVGHGHIHDDYDGDTFIDDESEEQDLINGEGLFY